MPITPGDLAIAGKYALNEYLRNIPVDQIGTEHPFLTKLMGKRKLFLGAKQGVVENVRKGYDDNTQWAYGDTPITFNKRDSVDQSEFHWKRAVSGLTLEHDRLFAAGIKVREGDRGAYKLEQNEKVQLVQLLAEQTAILKEGFTENLDRTLHRDGSASADTPVGLDLIVSTTPAVGTVGGINAATATYWRNHANLTLDQATMLDKMEAAWRACHKNGGAPDFILAGGDFIDVYRKCVTLTQNTEAGAVKRIDGGVGSGTSTGLYYKGVEIVWDPTFDWLQATETAAVNWNERCYFLNTKHLAYRDDEMDIVQPTRPHNILSVYLSVHVRCLLSTSRRNAHAVLALA